MTTANQFLDVAASQIGYHVKPGSKTKYGSWYGIPNGAWCAMFLSWVADQSGATDITPRFAWTPAGAQWFKDRGQWHDGVEGIQRGDYVFYDFPDNVHRIQHVGVVDFVHDDGSVTDIEGNTSGAGSQANGGALLRKRRKAYIVGYGRPSWGDSTPAQPVEAKNYLEKGDQGEAVAHRQRQLIAHGFGVGSVGADGIFGDGTEAGVIAFQRSRGIGVDGVIGPETAGHLDAPVAVNRPNVTELQQAVRTAADNVWGPNTDKHFDALREASNWGGNDFPYGVSFTQQVVGTTPDGFWGRNSIAAHDRTTAAVQSALWRLGHDIGSIDGIWGDRTEAGYQAVRNAARV